MANKDLRHWVGEVAAAGELKIINGAEPRREIGGIVDIYQRRMGNPAVMFDEVPGLLPRASRACQYPDLGARINIALGLPPQGSEMELIRWWRDYMRNAPSFPPARGQWRTAAGKRARRRDIDIGTHPDAGLARA